MQRDWRPSSRIETLRLRAELMTRIRQFFTLRGYLEVETPIMGRYGTTDVYLSNIKATFRTKSYSLQTSPEYHMKRLLAAGSGPIFQLARVFRDDELGRWHNPEFTLLEWYHLGVDHHVLMDEVDAFLQHIVRCSPMVRKTYQQVFLEVCGFDPFNTSLDSLREVVARYGLDNVLDENETDPDQYLFLLMSHVVEPALAERDTPVAVFNFPSSQAALAQIQNGFAERFEVYYRGVELANGFHELTDAKKQLDRFKQDQHIRQEKGLPTVEADLLLVAALEHGLPACSGVALGIDRLFALALDKNNISELLAFDFSRA